MRPILIFVTRQTLNSKVCSQSSYVSGLKNAVFGQFLVILRLSRSFFCVYRDHLLTYMALRRFFVMYEKQGFYSGVNTREYSCF